MNTHIMIDLESLGTKPGSRILSLGAVVIGPNVRSGANREFYLEFAINGQEPLLIEAETLEWWKQQDAAVRDRLFNPENKVDIKHGLDVFKAWLDLVAVRDKHGNLEVCVWGNGSDFDNALLQVAYGAFGMPMPWPFWCNRCYRTMKSLVPSIKIVRQGDHHNALDDARSQAEHLTRIYARLGMALS